MIKKMAGLALALVLVGCGPAPVSMPREVGKSVADGEVELPRADPRISHFMEKNSMLFAASKLTGVVSGTNLLWGAPSVATQKPKLPTMWLYTHTTGLAVRQETLMKPAFLDSMGAIGIRGLCFVPLFEGDRGPDIWQGKPTRLAPDLLFGSDDGYYQLLEAAEKKGIALGGLGIGSATGLGPDFYLALRGVGDYQGLFSMVEVPQNLWSLLPSIPKTEDARGGDEGVPLGDKEIEALTGVGLLPPAFSREADPLAPHLENAGWAASGEILGQDGNPHRWVYRYAGDPTRPVFQWDDPSAAAKRVLSASFVLQVGLWRQNLVGLSVEPFWGLDAAPAGQHFTPEPALSALSEQSREIRRYGGASFLADAFPVEAIPSLMAQGVDFVHSPLFVPQGAEVNPQELDNIVRGMEEHRINLTRLWNLPLVADTGANLGEVDDARLYFTACLPGLFMAPAGTFAASLAGTGKDRGQYAPHLRKIVLLRETLGLDTPAAGQEADPTITHRETGDTAVVAYSYPLPDGKTLLVAANFSGEEKNTTVAAPPHAQGRDMLQEKSLQTENGRITLKFLPWQCRILRIGAN